MEETPTLPWTLQNYARSLSILLGRSKQEYIVSTIQNPLWSLEGMEHLKGDDKTSQFSTQPHRTHRDTPYKVVT
jgi:hypothetical protein